MIATISNHMKPLTCRKQKHLMLSNYGHWQSAVANTESQISRDITTANFRNSMDSVRLMNLYQRLGILDNHHWGITLASPSNRGTNAGLTEAENAAAVFFGMRFFMVWVTSLDPTL